MQRCKAKSKRSGVQCKNFAIKGSGTFAVCMVPMVAPKQSKDCSLAKKGPLDMACIAVRHCKS